LLTGFANILLTLALILQVRFLRLQIIFFLSFLNSNSEESISLHPTNANGLLEICNYFKTAKAPGYDNLSMYVIKKSIDLIVEPLFFSFFLLTLQSND
jgi:hypothetical protein